MNTLFCCILMYLFCCFILTANYIVIALKLIFSYAILITSRPYSQPTLNNFRLEKYAETSYRSVLIPLYFTIKLKKLTYPLNTRTHTKCLLVFAVIWRNKWRHTWKQHAKNETIDISSRKTMKFNQIYLISTNWR